MKVLDENGTFSVHDFKPKIPLLHRMKKEDSPNYHTDSG